MKTKQFISLWNEDCDRAFRDLKFKLTSTPVLGYPDFSKPFIAEVDASLNSFGAVLAQEINKKNVVIAYALRTLRSSEKNADKYNSMLLELFNLKWSLSEKFRDYILGSKFSVYTTKIHQSFINCLTWSNRNEIGESVCAIRFYHQIHIRKSEQICGGIK